MAADRRRVGRRRRVAWLVVPAASRSSAPAASTRFVPLVAGGAVFALFYFTVAALLGIKEVGEVVDPMVRTGARMGSAVLRRARRTA